jgi:hypothetical protein
MLLKIGTIIIPNHVRTRSNKYKTKQAVGTTRIFPTCRISSILIGNKPGENHVNEDEQAHFFHNYCPCGGCGHELFVFTDDLAQYAYSFVADYKTRGRDKEFVA